MRKNPTKIGDKYYNEVTVDQIIKQRERVANRIASIDMQIEALNESRQKLAGQYAHLRSMDV